MYIDSFEYKDLKSIDKDKINGEINYIGLVLNIMSQVLSNKGKSERPIVGWMINPSIDYGYESIYHFSCIKVASMALSLDNSKISAICKGSRKSVGGFWEFDEESRKKIRKNAYTFRYKEDYDENKDYTFDPNSKQFKYK